MEVSIKGDEMAIGVFGSRQRLGEGGPKQIVDGISLYLEGVMGALGGNGDA